LGSDEHISTQNTKNMKKKRQNDSTITNTYGSEVDEISKDSKE
jgi:hypothetical protein